ncbi:MAG: choline-sulfatase [Planctomycetota bacterium]|jgi:choline-sulfatase
MFKNWKQTVRDVALVIGITVAGGCDSAQDKSKPTNLLFVVMDTTRADHLGCYGYDVRDTTPTVDALALEGLVLANTYSHSSLTPVSAGSFLSGTLPYRHGVRSLFMVGKESLSGEIPSLFGLLGSDGRATAGFVSAKPMGKQYGLNRGFDLYQDDLSATKERFEIKRFGDAPQRPGDETTDLALAWLAQNSARPFALMVHLFDAHDSSFLPPEKFLEEHLSFPFTRGLGRNPDHFPLDSVEQMLELYDAEIRFTDMQLERLIAKLEELGVRHETLIVVLADHGESFGEHGYFTHGWLSDEQLRVPLVLQGPGIAPGSRIESRVRTVDLLPTLAELFGVATPDGIDGVSVMSLVGQDDDPLEREVYAEVHHAPGDPRGREPQLYTLISGPWKYIHHPESQGHELYDLVVDPLESRNLFGEKSDLAMRLLGQLVKRGALGGGGVSLEGLSEEYIRNLQSLGYLGDVKRE